MPSNRQGHLHNTTSFSQILDCDHHGSCHGGNPAHAWSYNKKVGGACTEASYAYDPHHKKHNNTCLPCDKVPHSALAWLVHCEWGSRWGRNGAPFDTQTKSEGEQQSLRYREG